MTSSRRWTLGALVLAALVAAAVVVPLVVGGEYATRQTVARKFALDEDFTVVRKILVRTDAAKQIVTMGGDSEFVSQDWDAAGVDVDSVKLLDPDWKLDLHGEMRVRTKSDYVGQQEISLNQQVQIVPDHLDSQVQLDRPEGRLRDYAMRTRFDRDPGAAKTNVELELTQEILTHAPWFAHGIADRRVRDAAERTLANQEEAIRKLIAEHRDNVPLFPLR